MTTTSCHIKDLHLIAPGDDSHADTIAKLNDDAGLDPDESGAYTADDVLILGGDGGLDVVLWGSRDIVKHSLRELLDDLEATADTDTARTPGPETRYMPDELGNLQSDGHGIAGFETMLSIGLGREIIEATTDTADTATTAAPDLKVIDAAGAAGMVNDRLAAILPALQDAGFDIYLSMSPRDRRTSYIHVGRLGWAGYLEASDLPGRNHGYHVSFPLKPSRTHGSGVGVWTDRADDDGIYTDAADVVDALKLACSPTTTPAIYDTTLNNLSVAGLLGRPFPPTHILPTEHRTRKDQS